MTETKMTDEARSAMSIGMIQNRVVRNYLLSIQQDGVPKRRTRSAAELAEALAAATDPIERLKLRPLLREALEAESEENVGVLSKFIEHCASFSKRHGISYADWRDEGVPASVLKDAGMTRVTK